MNHWINHVDGIYQEKCVLSGLYWFTGVYTIYEAGRLWSHPFEQNNKRFLNHDLKDQGFGTCQGLSFREYVRDDGWIMDPVIHDECFCWHSYRFLQLTSKNCCWKDEFPFGLGTVSTKFCVYFFWWWTGPRLVQEWGAGLMENWASVKLESQIPRVDETCWFGDFDRPVTVVSECLV